MSAIEECKYSTIIDSPSEDSATTAIEGTPQTPQEDAHNTTTEDPDTLHGWLVVAASSLYLMCTVGVSNSYSVLLTYYLNTNYKNVKASTLSWIVTSMIVFAYLSTLATGPLIARFKYRTISFVGCALCTIGLVLASFANAVWQLILTQGMVFGVGSALTLTMLATVPVDWHVRHREIATGLSAASYGSGGIVFAKTTQIALSKYGFAWALRINALVLFVVCTATSTLIRRRTAVPDGVANVWRSMRDARVAVLGLASVFINMAYLIPWFYLPTAALGLGASEREATNLVLLLNIGDSVGKVAAACAATVVGPLNTSIAFFAVCVVLVPVFMVAVRSVVGYYVFAVLYGMLSTGPIGVLPLVLADMVGASAIATPMSALSLYGAVAVLVGTPLQGLVFDRVDRGNRVFVGTTVWCSVGIFIGVAFLILLKLMVVRKESRGVLSKM